MRIGFGLFAAGVHQQLMDLLDGGGVAAFDHHRNVAEGAGIAAVAYAHAVLARFWVLKSRSLRSASCSMAA